MAENQRTQRRNRIDLETLGGRRGDQGKHAVRWSDIEYLVQKITSYQIAGDTFVTDAPPIEDQVFVDANGETQNLVNYLMGTAVTADAAAGDAQQALADAESAAQQLGDVVRVSSASEGVAATLELISYSSGTGYTASAAVLDADNILLQGSVNASKLTVSDFSGNLVGNGSFVYGDKRGWLASSDGVADTYQGKTCIRFDTDAAHQYAYWSDDHKTPVSEGDYLSLSFRGATTAGGTADLRVSVAFYDSIGGASFAWENNLQTFNTTAWAYSTKQIAVPAGALYAHVYIARNAGGSGSAYMTDIEVLRSRPGTTLITPNSITTNELNVAGSVSALGLTVAAADITDTLEVGQIPSLPQSRIENLTSDISNAQGTADAAAIAAESRIKTFSQDTEPTATSIGDLWHDTTNNKFYRWSGSSWVSVAITADSVAADWVYAGQVSATQVSATSLDAISSNLGSIQVGFANIEDGAVTNQFAAVTASSLTITDNYQEVQSLQIDCAGNPVSLTFSASVGYYLQGKLEIRVDGGLREEIDFSPDMDTDSMSFSYGGSAYFTMGWPVTNTYSTVLNLEAGQHTISIRAKKTQNDSITSGPYIKERFLQTLELKR